MKIKTQKTPRDSMEHKERESDAQGTGGQKNKTPTTQDRQGTGLPVESRRGASRRADDGGRKREEETLGREDP